MVIKVAHRACGSSSLEALKTQFNMALRNLLWLTLIRKEGLE